LHFERDPTAKPRQNFADRAREPFVMSIFPEDVAALCALIVDEARSQGVRIATAESCTGGLVAAAICAVPGASDVFERGFVTYSNHAKQAQLGVPGDLIADVGAVSEPVARRMAEGALQMSEAQLTVSITGVAGPGGGTPMKPVGTVHFATGMTGRPIRHRLEQFGDLGREAVQLAALRMALELLRDRLS
jgi:nicotinamide-nucleotide amidase